MGAVYGVWRMRARGNGARPGADGSGFMPSAPRAIFLPDCRGFPGGRDTGALRPMRRNPCKGAGLRGAARRGDMGTAGRAGAPQKLRNGGTDSGEIFRDGIPRARRITPVRPARRRACNPIPMDCPAACPSLAGPGASGGAPLGKQGVQGLRRRFARPARGSCASTPPIPHRRTIPQAVATWKSRGKSRAISPGRDRNPLAALTRTGFSSRHGARTTCAS